MRIFTPPLRPWGAWVIFVPVLAAVGVAYLVKTFAPEAKGHGVPEVMDAIYYNDGKIRSVVAVIKSLASALSIGSGGSVGREGPIIQIGAAFGSTLGQLIAIPAKICPPRTARASPLCPSWKRRAFHVPSECLPRRAVRGLGAHSPIKPFSLHPLKRSRSLFLGQILVPHPPASGTRSNHLYAWY
jgi:hypothetical protein